MSPPEESRLAIALDYAARGWAVFPCVPRAKEPATKRGFYDATTNPATIRRWWLAQPDYNIGIATGAVSRIWVLDEDGEAGAATLRDLEAKYGPLPDTLCSITGCGRHRWFRADVPIQSSAARVGAGVDVRGDGGYVLAPPSVHPDGPVYRWDNSEPSASALDWLVQLTRTKPPPAPSISQRAISARGYPPCSGGAYGTAALDREINALVNTPPGSRNHALNRASFSLHQLVAGGELDGAEVRNRLIAAAEANGLMADPDDGPRRVALTIRSGARAGMQNPRSSRGAS
jgi:putative DNA primase/helicase